MVDAAKMATIIHEDEALQRALDLSPEQAARVDPVLLARGEYNINFSFVHPDTNKSYVIRQALGSQMHLEHQIEYEAHALALLKQSGRTPIVYYCKDEVLVEDWLPGRPLNYVSDWEVAAAILADIHAVPVPDNHRLVEPIDPLGAVFDECRAMFKRYCAWDGSRSDLVDSVERWFVYAKQTLETSVPNTVRCIVNTEVNSHNFLINEGGTSYLVDWEKPVVGEPEQDIAHFLAPTTTYWKTDTLLDKHQCELFLKKYYEVVESRFNPGISEKRLSAYLSTTCMRGITWCAMAFAQHNTGERMVADAYTLAKIEEFLTPTFLNFVEENYFLDI